MGFRRMLPLAAFRCPLAEQLELLSYDFSSVTEAAAVLGLVLASV